MAQVRAIHHVNLCAPVDTIETLRRFYVDIVGLEEGPRPMFRTGSRGYWLYANGIDIVHLLVDENGQPTSGNTGAFNHIAFACDDFDAARARLDAAGIAYGIDDIDELQQRQIYFNDPTGVGVELNFSPAMDAESDALFEDSL
ncbi:MAG TPA: VOC family protein [Oleiagrimonas sp.]|nr:VOC family protein [Oleiagrimonas sp.]